MNFKESENYFSQYFVIRLIFWGEIKKNSQSCQLQYFTSIEGCDL